jgi:hypothetical protein
MQYAVRQVAASRYDQLGPGSDRFTGLLRQVHSGSDELHVGLDARGFNGTAQALRRAFLGVEPAEALTKIVALGPSAAVPIDTSRAISQSSPKSVISGDYSEQILSFDGVADVDQ